MPSRGIGCDQLAKAVAGDRMSTERRGTADQQRANLELRPGALFGSVGGIELLVRLGPTPLAKRRSPLGPRLAAVELEVDDPFGRQPESPSPFSRHLKRDLAVGPVEQRSGSFADLGP
ncbi:MAG TPA: hypothetical protein DCQ98_16435 [Planctomycetaceae bacterium]|nr:hypothetical protein [Planctomycetaceae bacterium]